MKKPIIMIVVTRLLRGLCKHRERFICPTSVRHPLAATLLETIHGWRQNSGREPMQTGMRSIPFNWG